MATLHDYPLLGIAGIILLFAFLGWAALTDIPSALKTGKVKEFDRHRNTYNRKEEPFAFWSSIFIYVMIGGCCSGATVKSTLFSGRLTVNWHWVLIGLRCQKKNHGMWVTLIGRRHS